MGAIYASLERETALAEAEYRISLEPLRPSKGRVLYHLEIVVPNVVDLRTPGLLEELGISPRELADPLLIDRCQEIGGASAYVGYKGLLVPSVRQGGGVNLVVLEYEEFEVVDREEISPSG